MFAALRKSKPTGLLSPQLLSELGQNHPFTPDFWKLEVTQGQWVLVADEMLPDCRDHSLVNNEDCMRWGVAYTQRQFAMFRKMLGKRSYPVITPPPERGKGMIARAPVGVLKGVLYFVRPWQLAKLDIAKQNGVIFQRERVFLDLPVRTVQEHRVRLSNGHCENTRVLGVWNHFKTQSAWLYIAKPEYFFWDSYAQGFSTIKPRVPNDRNLKPYFEYKEDAD